MELAGERFDASFFHLQGLVEQTLDELGSSTPSHDEAQLFATRAMARKLLAEQIDERGSGRKFVLRHFGWSASPRTSRTWRVLERSEAP